MRPLALEIEEALQRPLRAAVVCVLAMDDSLRARSQQLPPPQTDCYGDDEQVVVRVMRQLLYKMEHRSDQHLVRSHTSAIVWYTAGLYLRSRILLDDNSLYRYPYLKFRSNKWVAEYVVLERDVRLASDDGLNDRLSLLSVNDKLIWVKKC